MEDFLILGALAIVFGPWVLVIVMAVRRSRERHVAEVRFNDMNARFMALERRVSSLQTELEKLRPAAAGTAPASAATRAPAGSPMTRPVGEPGSAEMPAPKPLTPAGEAAPPPPPPPAPRPAEAEPIKVVIPQRPTPVADAPLAAGGQGAASAGAPPVPAVTGAPPTFGSAPPAPSLGDQLKSLLDIEETLGANWLNKVGVAILVLGVVFFLAYQLKTLGPAGKVLVGVVVSLALLGGGLWLERRERYRIPARALLGGGWALLYFTGYAMYHVPAAKVLESQALDLGLLLAISAAMVAHTLRYNSQVVSGMAFLLAFTSVAINRVDVLSLAANVILALAFVVVAGRKRWFELEVFGLLALYLNHFFWLRPIIEPMGAVHRPFPEFFASATILVMYWAVFRVSYLWRRIEEEREEHISTIAALLNAFLLLGVMKYQSVRPDLAFWFLLGLGAVELALGQLPITRRRYPAFAVLTTLGAAMLVAAFPFRYSGWTVAAVWIAEAQALVLAGIFTREALFRRLGMVAGFFVAGHLIAVEAAQVLGARLDGGDVSARGGLALVFAVAAAAFYVNAHWLPRRWPALFDERWDEPLARLTTYLGGTIAFLGAWLAFPEAGTAVAWAALVLALLMAARRFQAPELSYQGSVIAALVVLRVLALNLPAVTPEVAAARLWTVLAVVVLLYLAARWSAVPRVDVSRWLGGAYTWAASVLGALLMWYELQAISVAPAWAVFGLALLEAGSRWRLPTLRWQGYAALASAFLRLFLVNLNAAGAPGEISPRFYTVVPLALAFYYVYARLREEELSGWEDYFRVAGLHAWFGSIAIVALARFEVDLDWVAAAWAALALVLLTVAWRSGQRVFQHQAVLLALAVAFRTATHNFYERHYFPATPGREPMLTAGAVVALLLLGLPLARLMRGRLETGSGGNVIARLWKHAAARPEQVFFFLPIGLLTVLLWLEMPSGMITIAWGVEGVAVFLFALLAKERSYRLCGLALLLLCVGKIVLMDVWGLNARDRYITLLVLGSALVGVSLLYTRHRETLRRFL